MYYRIATAGIDVVVVQRTSAVAGCRDNPGVDAVPCESRRPLAIQKIEEPVFDDRAADSSTEEYCRTTRPGRFGREATSPVACRKKSFAFSEDFWSGCIRTPRMNCIRAAARHECDLCARMTAAFLPRFGICWW